MSLLNCVVFHIAVWINLHFSNALVWIWFHAYRLEKCLPLFGNPYENKIKAQNRVGQLEARVLVIDISYSLQYCPNKIRNMNELQFWHTQNPKRKQVDRNKSCSPYDQVKSSKMMLAQDLIVQVYTFCPIVRIIGKPLTSWNWRWS